MYRTHPASRLIALPALLGTMGGHVSKRLSARYRLGPSRDWIKVKNPDSPAMIRAREAEW
jgi:hypothetical protein